MQSFNIYNLAFKKKSNINDIKKGYEIKIKIKKIEYKKENKNYSFGVKLINQILKRLIYKSAKI